MEVHIKNALVATRDGPGLLSTHGGHGVHIHGCLPHNRVKSICTVCRSGDMLIPTDSLHDEALFSRFLKDLEKHGAIFNTTEAMKNSFYALYEHSTSFESAFISWFTSICWRNKDYTFIFRSICHIFNVSNTRMCLVNITQRLDELPHVCISIVVFAMFHVRDDIITLPNYETVLNDLFIHGGHDALSRVKIQEELVVRFLVKISNWGLFPRKYSRDITPLEMHFALTRQSWQTLMDILRNFPRYTTNRDMFIDAMNDNHAKDKLCSVITSIVRNAWYVRPFRVDDSNLDAVARCGKFFIANQWIIKDRLDECINTLIELVQRQKRRLNKVTEFLDDARCDATSETTRNKAAKAKSKLPP